ncbi:hypothetical protein ABS71_05145 [bacterium SCN 62-11]|nr:hypothetical protein [Candidatus Eremiobacteraeota bacterium]ODT74857.1 MAG: hypothetical protein ABS71_05145 [bacterium SCN 62-11]
MDARALVTLVENLLEQPYDSRLQTNLHFILEGLEGIHGRHRAPKSQPQDEELRQLFLQHLTALYQGLQELDSALLSQDPDQKKQAVEQIREAAGGFNQLNERLENESSLTGETL